MSDEKISLDYAIQVLATEVCNGSARYDVNDVLDYLAGVFDCTLAYVCAEYERWEALLTRVEMTVVPTVRTDADGSVWQRIK